MCVNRQFFKETICLLAQVHSELSRFEILMDKEEIFTNFHAGVILI